LTPVLPLQFRAYYDPNITEESSSMIAFRGTLRSADGSVVQRATGLLRRITTGPKSRFEGRMQVAPRTIQRLAVSPEEYELDIEDGPHLRIKVEGGRVGYEALGAVEFLSNGDPLRDSDRY
jgi:hypothetical protein